MKKSFLRLCDHSGSWVLRTFSLSALALLFTISVVAQTVTGTVTDTDTGDPLIGATILEKGTSNGTATDIDGKYSLTLVGTNPSLIVSYTGFSPTTVEVNGRTTVDVGLSAGVQLKEAIVTALGIAKDEKSLGYSQQSVSGDDIQSSAETNVLNALQGKVAGVSITDGNGISGSTTKITLRGNNSLVEGKNQPLIIVDGVPIDNRTTGAGSSSWNSEEAGRDWGSGINNINAWDIADMTVLKGPNAAALYGSRGANGVIIITTKKGTQRQGIGIDFNMTQMFEEAYRYRDMQNEFGGGNAAYKPASTYVYDVDANTGNKLLPRINFWGSGVSWGPRMDGTPVQWWNDQVLPFSPQPDNYSSFFDGGTRSEYNVAFSGGGEYGTLRASLTRSETTPIYPNTSREQNSLNLNASINVTEKLTAAAAISYFDVYQLNAPVLGNSEASIGKHFSWNGPRNYRLDMESCCWQNPDGTRAPAGVGFSRNNWRGYGRAGSFFWNLYKNNQERSRDRLLGSLSLSMELTPWLTAEGRLGIDNFNDDNVAKNTPNDSEGLLGGRYSRTLGRNRIENHTAYLRANKDLTEDLNLTANLGTEIWSQSYYSIQGDNGGDNFVDPYLYTFRNSNRPLRNSNNGTAVFNQVVPGESFLDKEIQSVFASVDLSYKDFLYLALTGRNDWSSTLPVNNNSYFYPSASVGFVFSEIMETGPISFGKLRLSYAQVANDTDPYQLQPTFSRSNFGGQPTSFVSGTIPPIELAPEEQRSYEAGLDLRFFNGKLNFDFTYYHIQSYNQILSSPLPVSSGYGALRFNTGELENSGYEILISGTPIQTNSITWEVGINAAHNDNKVVSLSEGAKLLNLGGVFGGNGPAIEARPGENFGTIVGWDYTYFDRNGNGATDPSEQTPENRIIDNEGKWYKMTAQRVPVGNANPDLVGGLTNSISWKNLRLNSLIDFRFGGDIYYGSWGIGTAYGQSPGSLECRDGGCMSYTHSDGNTYDDGTVKPGVFADGSTNSTVVSAQYKHRDLFGWGAQSGPTSPIVGEAAWVRLKEISLEYRFPQTLTNKLGFIQNASITLQARNLGFLWDTGAQDWDNIDPSAVNGAGIGNAFEWAALPTTRTIGFILRTSF